LDAVRDIAHSLADSAVPGDVVEQFQVMNVHNARREFDDNIVHFFRRDARLSINEINPANLFFN